MVTQASGLKYLLFFTEAMRPPMPPPRAALDILPLELWDIVIASLVDPLVLAHVSQALNERCVRAASERASERPVEWARVRTGQLDYGRDVLRAVAHYVPLEALPLTDLSVELIVPQSISLTPQLGAQLFELYHIVSHAPRLHRLTVRFDAEVRWSNNGWQHIFVNRAMKTLCAILARAAARAPGPVIVDIRKPRLSGKPAVPFTCRPTDIAEWELDNATSRFNPPGRWTPRRLLQPKRLQVADGSTLTRCHDGTVALAPSVHPFGIICWARVHAGSHRCSLLALHEHNPNDEGLTHLGESTQRLFGMPLHNVLRKHSHLLVPEARLYGESME
ncbi:F-box domain-containing protein [Mycena indigotica]|uniref:F-box domain-containing protein n=1 Tax=Mycena indigotica TaxID=2126181 RepID=A0A8H6SDI0_9AGAR|nr:F-box domain-containing protein [Mycena indigotica]KAF7297530.1 F-box domain-containing protein [Mycena indigotica]